MFLSNYQAMQLLLVVMLASQSLAAYSSILSNPRQLNVRADPDHAVITVSRTVTTSTGAASTPAGGSAPSNDNATVSTTTAMSQHQPSKMTGVIEVEFVGIRELSSNSSEVGGMSHSFYEFNNANLGFLAAHTMTDKMPTNPLPSTNVNGVCQHSRAVLHRAGTDAPNATVVAKMCALESSGSAVRDGEEMTLTEGQFHMSVEVEDWQWCGCGQQEGAYLEFNLTVAVPAGYKINRTSSDMPVKISLGTNDSFIMVSTKYEASAMWRSMPEGYPMLTLLDEQAVRANVTVRVPRQGSGERLTIMTLTVEPGYISSEHVQPGPTSSAPRYIGTPALTIATASVFMMAIMFSRR